MILIDDTLNTSLGNSLTDIKEFTQAQPGSVTLPEAAGTNNLV